MKYWFSMIKYLLCWESGYIHASYTLRPFLPLRCTIAPLWMPEGWLDLLQASLTSSFYEMHLASPTCPPVKQILVVIILKTIISMLFFGEKNRVSDNIILIVRLDFQLFGPFEVLKQTSFSQLFWTEKTRELTCVVWLMQFGGLNFSVFCNYQEFVLNIKRKWKRLVQIKTFLRCCKCNLSTLLAFTRGKYPSLVSSITSKCSQSLLWSRISGEICRSRVVN